MVSKHDRLASSLAKKMGGDYNTGKGPDIRVPGKVVEVETDPNAFTQAITQLQGFKDPRYIATSKENVPTLKERLQDTKIGIISEDGRVVKKAEKPGPD